MNKIIYLLKWLFAPCFFVSSFFFIFLFSLFYIIVSTIFIAFNHTYNTINYDNKIAENKLKVLLAEWFSKFIINE